MKSALQLIFSVLLVTSFVTPASAQTPDVEPEKPTVTEAEATEAEGFYRAATQAFDKGEYETALFELDRAWRLEKRTAYLYQRILVLEAMGRSAMALELLDGNRDALLESSDVNDLFVVEERLRNQVDADTKPKQTDNPGVYERSTLNLVGPIALGVVGAGATVWGILLFGDDCELESAGGECLSGTEANIPVAGAITGVGVAALVGAVVWFIVTTPDDPPAASSHFILTPGGFGVSF